MGMKRKVIQIANSTQLVSLPRKWALRYNIQRGDDIDVEVNGNRLIISAEKEQELPKCSLELPKSKKHQQQALYAAYLKGYDEVEIKYDSSAQLNTIQQLLLEFAGYDIVSQTRNMCTIKQISRPSPEEFASIMNRLALLLMDTCQNIIDGAKNDEHELLESAAFRDQTIRKFSNFCLRLINKGRGVDASAMTSTYLVIRSMQQLGDEYMQLARELLSEKKQDRALVHLLEQILEAYRQTYKVLKTKKLPQNSTFMEMNEQMTEDLQTLIKNKKCSQNVFYHVRNLVTTLEHLQSSILVILV